MFIFSSCKVTQHDFYILPLLFAQWCFGDAKMEIGSAGAATKAQSTVLSLCNLFAVFAMALQSSCSCGQDK